MVILLDLGKFISKVKRKKKWNVKSNLKGVESQLKCFKGTDVSSLLMLGLLPLINRASETLLLNLLCLYPKLRIVKS